MKLKKLERKSKKRKKKNINLQKKMRKRRNLEKNREKAFINHKTHFLQENKNILGFVDKKNKNLK